MRDSARWVNGTTDLEDESEQKETNLPSSPKFDNFCVFTLEAMIRFITLGIPSLASARQ